MCDMCNGGHHKEHGNGTATLAQPAPPAPFAAVGSHDSAADFQVSPNYRLYTRQVYVERPPKRWVVGTTGAVLGGLSLLVTLFDPRTHGVGVCPMVLFFGIQCPACGATRATHLMFRGHFLEALHYNALWVVLFPFCLYGLFSWALHAAFGRRVIPRLRIDSWIPNAVLAAMVAFFVVRNLPIEFLHVLNPP